MPMANTVTSISTTTQTFSRIDTRSSRNLQDQTTTSVSQEFTAGTGALQIDAAYESSGIVPAGGHFAIDFANLQQSIFGINQTINFHLKTVKGITILNTGATTGIFNVVATGFAGLTEVFGGHVSGISVPPFSAFSYINRSGIAISDGADSMLFLKNDVGTASFDISIIGVTG